MKRILMIILDGQSASGICVDNVAKDLAEEGYSIDILSYRNDNVHFDKKIRRIYIAPKFFIALQEWAKKNNFRLLKKYFSIAYSVQVAATSLFIWPWNSPLYTLKLYRKVKQLHMINGYNCIIPVYNPLDPLIVSHKLKKRYPELILIPYFLDSLSGGATPKLLSKERKINKGLVWENKLLGNADNIIVMKSSEKHHFLYSSNRDYYEKITVLDIPAITKPQGANHIEKTSDINSNIIELVYIGSMPLSIRQPYYGLDILKEFDNVRIKFVGPIPESMKYFEYCKGLEQVSLIGSVPYETVGRFMDEADVMLNFGNNITEMVPSKIFEYISYGKPILSFSPNNSDPSIQYLQEYSNSCIVIETDSREENIQKIREFLLNYKKGKIAFDDIKRTFYLNTPECTSKFICSLINKDRKL